MNSKSRPYAIGLICARGGSKGVPRKNLRVLAGKPLIAWAIEVARACPSIDRVIVSTEDTQIADVAKSYGAEVPFLRPVELAQDDSPELHVWQHCLRTLNTLDNRTPEVLVNIPATAPLRTVDDVEACVAGLVNTDADLNLTVIPAQRNPYFTMVTVEEGLVSKLIATPGSVFRRQDAPKVFDIVPVAYAARAEYVLQTKGLLDGRVRATVVAPERSADIDTEMDFRFVEFLLKNSET